MPPPETEGLPVPEGVPPEARPAGEQARLYPMEEADLVDLLTILEVGEDGNVDEIASVIGMGLAYREGLDWGVDDYDLTDEGVLLELQNTFTTKEGATSRPTAYYLRPAMSAALGSRVRESKLHDSHPTLWKKLVTKNNNIPEGEDADAFLEVHEKRIEGYKKARNDLIRLENHMDARQVTDTAFTQRMLTCENPENAAKLGDDPSVVTPDKGHHEALFYGKWGEKVNDVFWEMASFGLPESVLTRIGRDPIPDKVKNTIAPERRNNPDLFYVESIDQTSVFKSWLQQNLKVSEGRMDITWKAWQLMLTWEVANELGNGVNDKGDFKIIAPPIGNSLLGWTSHHNEKRLLEFGLGKKKGDAQGEQLERKRIAKYISHSGLPITLGKFPPLCRSYLHEATIKMNRIELNKRPGTVENLLANLPTDPNQHKDFEEKHGVLRKDLIDVIAGRKKSVEISQWDLGLYGKLGFAGTKHTDEHGTQRTEIYPWLLTQVPEPDMAPGELAPGTFGFWMLTRSRAWKVIEDIRSRPELRDLTNADFFAQRIRNWEKVLGPLEQGTPPEENPRTWMTAAWIYYRMPGFGEQKVKLVKKNPQRSYRTRSKGQTWNTEKEGRGDPGSPGLGDIFRHALNCGWLREEDVFWIKEQLETRIGIGRNR